MTKLAKDRQNGGAGIDSWIASSEVPMEFVRPVLVSLTGAVTVVRNQNGRNPKDDVLAPASSTDLSIKRCIANHKYWSSKSGSGP